MWKNPSRLGSISMRNSHAGADADYPGRAIGVARTKLFLAHRRRGGAAHGRERIVALRHPDHFAPRAREKPFSIASQELTDVQARIERPGPFRHRNPDCQLHPAQRDAYRRTWNSNMRFAVPTIVGSLKFAPKVTGRLRWNAMLRLTHMTERRRGVAPCRTTSALRRRRFTAWPAIGFSTAGIRSVLVGGRKIKYSRLRAHRLREPDVHRLVSKSFHVHRFF